MRHIPKLIILLVAAIAFSAVMAPVIAATLEDALLGFLDAQTVMKVTNYFRATEGSRVVGMTLLLLFWGAIVVAIDRLLDVVTANWSKRQTSQSS